MQRARARRMAACAHGARTNAGNATAQKIPMASTPRATATRPEWITTQLLADWPRAQCRTRGCMQLKKNATPPRSAACSQPDMRQEDCRPGHSSSLAAQQPKPSSVAWRTSRTQVAATDDSRADTTPTGRRHSSSSWRSSDQRQPGEPAAIADNLASQQDHRQRGDPAARNGRRERHKALCGAERSQHGRTEASIAKRTHAQP